MVSPLFRQMPGFGGLLRCSNKAKEPSLWMSFKEYSRSTRRLAAVSRAADSAPETGEETSTISAILQLKVLLVAGRVGLLKVESEELRKKSERAVEDAILRARSASWLKSHDQE